MVDLAGLYQHPEPAPYPFGPSSVADILDEGLENHPDRLALIDGDRTWTWSDLDDAVAAVATGIAAGEQIWWALGNCAETVIGALATFRAGGIWVGRSAKDPRTELAELEQRIGGIRLIDSVDHLPSGDLARPIIDPGAPALVTFTSGTTGRPKVVVHSQRNLLWPGLLSAELEPPEPGERIGTPLSLMIANILALGPLSALLRSSTTVIMRRTYSAGLAEDIERDAVTRTFLVPTILHDLVEDSAVRPQMLSSLDRVIVGGSGAEPRLLWDFLDRFDVRPTLSYGLSEAPTGIVRESLDDPIGSKRGFALPHVIIEIVAPDDTLTPTGSMGEICVSPATSGRWANTWTPTLGYAGEPDRTADLFRTGRLHTGDLGKLDSDGALSVMGRMSDVIIRGGQNIDPFEIEAQLTALPFVQEALVVGIPDPRLGQQVGALLVMEQGPELPFEVTVAGDLNADSLDFVEMAMTYEEETGIRLTDLPLDRIALVHELPRNAMGKVIRTLPRDFLDPDILP
ncbi:MAG: class I adenylate-forming enzyme family protein [Acidimicrobiia bacterium]|nr:class I adenylate-forming enzyme family protein [Acidimicrobiia bacterium]